MDISFACLSRHCHSQEEPKPGRDSGSGIIDWDFGISPRWGYWLEAVEAKRSFGKGVPKRELGNKETNCGTYNQN